MVALFSFSPIVLMALELSVSVFSMLCIMIKSLLPLKVRGKILWFENNSHCVVLTLKQGEEAGQLLWFPEQLHKDIGDLQAAPNDLELKSRKMEVLEDLEEIVNNSLKDLCEHVG